MLEHVCAVVGIPHLSPVVAEHICRSRYNVLFYIKRKKRLKKSNGFSPTAALIPGTAVNGYPEESIIDIFKFFLFKIYLFIQ